MNHARRFALLASLMLATTGAGMAQKPLGGNRLSLASEIYVERLQQAKGAPFRELVPAATLAHGDRVVTLLRWQAGRTDAAKGFTLTNALPAGLAWQASASEDEEVSVDGGHVWGHLGQLMIGERLAAPEDVTHVRWHISPQRARTGSGRITYSGLVR